MRIETPTSLPGLFRGLEDRLAALERRAPESPKGLSTLQGFAVYGAGFAPPTFYRHAGRVHLAGLVRAVGPSFQVSGGFTSLGQLPAGYRPAARLLFAASVNESHRRLDLTPSGGVLVFGTVALEDYVSLDGISFRHA